MFDYQMAVYELYEYGDVHVMNCYCVHSFFLSLFLQISAISCMRWKFKKPVYKLYEYRDVHVMISLILCFLLSFCLCFFTDKCNILHEAEV